MQRNELPIMVIRQLCVSVHPLSVRIVLKQWGGNKPRNLLKYSVELYKPHTHYNRPLLSALTWWRHFGIGGSIFGAGIFNVKKTILSNAVAAGRQHKKYSFKNLFVHCFLIRCKTIMKIHTCQINIWFHFKAKTISPKNHLTFIVSRIWKSLKPEISVLVGFNLIYFRN